VAVDWARRRRAAKRGGDDRRVPLDETIEALRLSPDDVLTIDEALNELAAVDPRAAKLVTMRYFLGLGDAEIADALGVTDRTVRRDWTFARAWLHRRLEASFVEPATPPCP
jgi:RNA polymerase sigma factor (TIGR02999 family)